MLTLAPLKDKNEIENIFAEKNIKSDEFSGIVAAHDGQNVIGLCLYSLDDKKITVLHIEPLNDIPLADGILRSTLHVAAERGIMNAFYAETLSEDFLLKIDFIKAKEEKSLDIDKLFKSCCGCK